MAAQGKITPQEVYGNTIGMLVAFGLPFLLPVVVGLLATRLFYLETECDTLKQLRGAGTHRRTDCRQAAGIDLVCLFVTFLAAGSCVLAGAALCGGYVETALPIWRTALLDGIYRPQLRCRLSGWWFSCAVRTYFRCWPRCCTAW